MIEYVEQVSGLSQAPNLIYLSLEGNPITDASMMYRYDIAKLFPTLLALDQNIVMHDERYTILDHKSIRYCTMNTFSEINPAVTTSFVADFSASKHIRFLEEQITHIKEQ